MKKPKRKMQYSFIFGIIAALCFSTIFLDNLWISSWPMMFTIPFGIAAIVSAKKEERKISDSSQDSGVIGQSGCGFFLGIIAIVITVIFFVALYSGAFV